MPDQDKENSYREGLYNPLKTPAYDIMKRTISILSKGKASNRQTNTYT
jgi:hypothetical protein